MNVITHYAPTGRPEYFVTNAIEKALYWDVSTCSSCKDIYPLHNGKCYKMYCMLVSYLVSIVFHLLIGICVKIQNFTKNFRISFSNTRGSLGFHLPTRLVLRNTTESWGSSGFSNKPVELDCFCVPINYFNFPVQPTFVLQ